MFCIPQIYNMDSQSYLKYYTLKIKILQQELEKRIMVGRDWYLFR